MDVIYFLYDDYHTHYTTVGPIKLLDSVSENR